MVIKSINNNKNRLNYKIRYKKHSRQIYNSLTTAGSTFEIIGWIIVWTGDIQCGLTHWLTRAGLTFEISKRGPSTSLLHALWAARLFAIAIWFLFSNQPFHHLPTYSFTDSSVVFCYPANFHFQTMAGALLSAIVEDRKSVG